MFLILQNLNPEHPCILFRIEQTPTAASSISLLVKIRPEYLEPGRPSIVILLACLYGGRHEADLVAFIIWGWGWAASTQAKIYTEQKINV